MEEEETPVPPEEPSPFDGQQHHLREAHKNYESMLKTGSETAVEGALRIIEDIMRTNATTARDDTGTVSGLWKCL